MYAIEFQTKINNGSIEIPLEFRDKLAGEARVIVLMQEQPATGENLTAAGENLIDRLLAKPIALDAFKPLAREEIYRRT